MSAHSQVFVSYKGKIPDVATIASFDDEGNYVASAESKFSPFTGQRAVRMSDSSANIIAEDFADVIRIGECENCKSVHKADLGSVKAMIHNKTNAFHCLDCGKAIDVDIAMPEFLRVAARADKANDGTATDVNEEVTSPTPAAAVTTEQPSDETKVDIVKTNPSDQANDGSGDCDVIDDTVNNDGNNGGGDGTGAGVDNTGNAGATPPVAADATGNGDGTSPAPDATDGDADTEAEAKTMVASFIAGNTDVATLCKAIKAGKFNDEDVATLLDRDMSAEDLSSIYEACIAHASDNSDLADLADGSDDDSVDGDNDSGSNDGSDDSDADVIDDSDSDGSLDGDDGDNSGDGADDDDDDADVIDDDSGSDGDTDPGVNAGDSTSGDMTDKDGSGDGDADTDSAKIIIAAKNGNVSLSGGKIKFTGTIKLADVAKQLTDEGATLDYADLFTGKDDNEEGKTFAELKANPIAEGDSGDTATFHALDKGVNWKSGKLFLVLDDTASAYFVFADGRPVARLIRNNAHSDNAKLFESEAFTKSFERQIREGKSVSRFGYVPYSIAIDTAKIKQGMNDKQLADTAASLSADYDRRIDVLKDCIVTATVAANKGVWNDYSNPVKDSLITKLVAMGVEDSASIVEKVFADHAQEGVEAVLSKALEIAGKPDVARKEIRTLVDTAKYAVSAPSLTEKLTRVGMLTEDRTPPRQERRAVENHDSASITKDNKAYNWQQAWP